MHQGLLAVPFVLRSQPTAVYQEHSAQLSAVAEGTHQRYADIFLDVENLILDHSTSAPRLIPVLGSRSS